MDSRLTFRNAQNLFRVRDNIGQLFRRMVLRVLAGYQVFDGSVKSICDRASLNSIRKPVSGNPTLKCLVRDFALLSNYFLFCAMSFYQFVNSFPKCRNLFIHVKSILIKSAKKQLIYLTKYPYSIYFILEGC